MSETKATFSGAKWKTFRAVDDYRVVTGRGESAKRALDDLGAEVFKRVGGLAYTPVGGATVLYDHLERVWVAYQAFIIYDDKEFEE